MQSYILYSIYTTVHIVTNCLCQKIYKLFFRKVHNMEIKHYQYNYDQDSPYYSVFKEYFFKKTQNFKKRFFLFISQSLSIIVYL